MKDQECVAFLQWASPRLGLRWEGYRNVQGQVCKRIRRRSAALELTDLAAYRAWLLSHPEEWNVLERLCVVTISRFYRDASVWDTLRDSVLPELAHDALTARDDELRCWSVGCASGEEPYTLALVWHLVLAERYPGLRLRIVATDVDERVLARARAGVYAAGTLRELPVGWRDIAFEPQGASFTLRAPFRRTVELCQQDVRRALPDETFRLVLCRNVALTYFAEPLRRDVIDRVASRLCRGGAFVAGRHEQRPDTATLEPWHDHLAIYRAANGV